MKSIKYLIIVILLTGCAGQTLHRQGATEADAMKDNMECELQGAQYASGKDASLLRAPSITI